MYKSYILVGLIYLVNGYVDTREDRDYFQLILREFEQYPILKQTLIHICRQDFDKCKKNQILRTSMKIIHDNHQQKNFDYLIECFTESRRCHFHHHHHHHWQQWSQWSSCSVTCGKGYFIRIRSCKPDHQCSIKSNRIEMKDCYAGSCVNNPSKNNLILYWKKFQSKENHWNLIVIFLFPFMFTLICLPLCILYYIYEIDFKIHAWFIYGFSQYNRCCETTTGNNRRRRRRRINII